MGKGNQMSLAFTLPDEKKSNRITQTDINKGELRITVAFKKYFSANEIRVNIDNLEYIIQYEKRVGRSDIMKLGKKTMNLLRLNAGNSLNFYQISENNFLIEKV